MAVAVKLATKELERSTETMEAFEGRLRAVEVALARHEERQPRKTQLTPPPTNAKLDGVEGRVDALEARERQATGQHPKVDEEPAATITSKFGSVKLSPSGWLLVLLAVLAFVFMGVGGENMRRLLSKYVETTPVPVIEVVPPALPVHP